VLTTRCSRFSGKLLLPPAKGALWNAYQSVRLSKYYYHKNSSWLGLEDRHFHLHGTKCSKSRQSQKMVKKYSTISVIRRFITVFTKTRHWFSSLARLIQCTPRAVFKLLRRKKSEFTFLYNAPRLLEGRCLLQGSQASPVCPSDKNNM